MPLWIALLTILFIFFGVRESPMSVSICIFELEHGGNHKLRWYRKDMNKYWTQLKQPTLLKKQEQTFQWQLLLTKLMEWSIYMIVKSFISIQ